jgi:hypothetical protein
MPRKALDTATCSQQLTKAALKRNDLRGGRDIPDRNGFSNSLEIIEANHKRGLLPDMVSPKEGSLMEDGGRLFRLQRLRDHDLALEVDRAQRSS